LLIILFLACTAPSAGQKTDTLFYSHLVKEGLLREQSVWWRNQSTHDAEIKALEARFLLETGDYPKLFSLMQRQNFSALDSCQLEKASGKYILLNDSIRKLWFKEVALLPIPNLTARLYGLSEEKDNKWTTDLDSRIYPAFSQMRMAQQKKRNVAIFLDVALPGAGKAYLGMPRHGLQTGLVVILLGITSVESISKGGVGSLMAVLNLTALSTVYLSNIFGTAYQHQNRKKLYTEAYYYEVQKYTSLYHCN